MSEVVEVKTIAEVERIVYSSGVWNGTGPVEFSNDGETWTQAWSPTPEHAHPEFARVTVHRKGIDFPTTPTIRWDEQVPQAANPEAQIWRAKWDASPMRHFGRTVRMVAFRQTFRELLGNIVIEDEDRASTPDDTAPPAERDWETEILAAATADELGAVVRDARAARVFKPTPEGTALDRLWKSRRVELAETDRAREQIARDPRVADALDPVPARAVPLSPDEQAQHDRFFPEDAARPVPHPPTVKLTPVSAAAPKNRRAPRRPTAVSTALGEAAERAQAEGRPVDRSVRRAARGAGKP